MDLSRNVANRREFTTFSRNSMASRILVAFSQLFAARLCHGEVGGAVPVDIESAEVMTILPMVEKNSPIVVFALYKRKRIYAVVREIASEDEVLCCQ